MDVPEETGHQFKMVLTKPIQLGRLEDGILPLQPLNTVCVFEWSGYFDGNGTRTKDSGRESVRIYDLRDIVKQ